MDQRRLQTVNGRGVQAPLAGTFALGNFGTRDPSIPNLPLGAAAGAFNAGDPQINFRCGSAVDWGTRTNTTITAPPTISDGDLLLLFWERYQTGVTTPGGMTAPTPPAGFTLYDPAGEGPIVWQVAAGGADIFGVFCYYKRASSESGSYTVTHGSTDCEAYLAVFENVVSSGSPFGAYGSRTASTSSTAGSAAGITHTESNSRLCYLMIDQNGSGGLSPPTPMAEHRDAGIYFATQWRADANATGDRTQTTGDNYWATRMFELLVEPAAAGAQDLTPALYASSATFHAATVGRGSVDLTPSLYASGQTFHAATVTSTYALTAALFTDGDTFHAATVAAGAVDLSASLFTNASAFYTHTIANVGGATQDLAPSLFTDGDTFHAATVAAGAVNLSAALFTSAATFHSATITTGAVTLAPSLYASSQTFHAATVAVGAQDLTPALFVGASTFPTHAITVGAVTLAPSLFTAAASFHAATVSTGSVGLAPALFSNGATFHAPTVAPGAVTLAPALFTDGDTFHAATVAPGAVGLAASLFANGATFYTHQVASADGALSASLVVNASSFHAATITTGAVALQPSLVVNASQFHAPAVTEGGQQVAAIGGAWAWHRRALARRKAKAEPDPVVFVDIAGEIVGEAIVRGRLEAVVYRDAPAAGYSVASAGPFETVVDIGGSVAARTEAPPATIIALQDRREWALTDDEIAALSLAA